MECESRKRIAQVELSSLEELDFQPTSNKTTKQTNEEYQKKDYLDNKAAAFLNDFLTKNSLRYYYYCKICSRFELTLTLFELHFKNIHRIEVPYKPLQCPLRLCKAAFRVDDKISLQLHVKSQHLGYNIKCSFCEQVFGSESDKIEHESKYCNRRNVVLLDFADSEYESDGSFVQNWQYQSEAIRLFKKFLWMQSQTDTFSCKLCNGDRVCFANVRKHFQLVHNNKYSKQHIQCPVDDCTTTFAFTRQYELVWHMKAAHLTISCRICDEGFLDDIFRIYHEFKVHGLPKVVLPEIRKSKVQALVKAENLFVQCKYCNEHFKLNIARAHHERNSCTMRNQINQDVENQIDLKKIYRDRETAFLKEFIENNSKLYYCKICSKFEKSVQLFEIHLKVFHNMEITERSLDCPVSVCKAKFRVYESQKLNYHIKTRHLGYCVKCRFCDELFRLNRARANHENNMCSRKNRAASSPKVLPLILPKTELLQEPLPKIGCDSNDSIFLNNFVSKAFTKLFYCKICNNFVETSELFESHLKNIHEMPVPNEPLQCPVHCCNIKFKVDEARKLHQHVKVYHLGYYVKCSFCDEVFRLVRERIYHEGKWCTENKKVIQASSFKHEIEQKKQVQNKGGCHEKDLNFLKDFLLKNESKFDFYCKICNKFQITLTIYEIHLRNKHKVEVTEEPLHCPVRSCLAKFRTDQKQRLQQHVKSQHMGYNMKCNYCDEVFKFYVAQAIHEKKSCTRKNVFLNHLDTVSESNELHPSNDFVQNWQYQNNTIVLFRKFLKMQSDSDTFACKMCKGQTISLKDIFEHFHSVHNTENVRLPIQCPVEDCTTTFSVNKHTNLTWHLKFIHLPIKCRLCDEGFIDDVFRIYHESKLHGLPKVVLEKIPIENYKVLGDLDCSVINIKEEIIEPESPSSNQKVFPLKLENVKQETNFCNPEDFIEEEFVDTIPKEEPK